MSPREEAHPPGSESDGVACGSREACRQSVQLVRSSDLGPKGTGTADEVRHLSELIDELRLLRTAIEATAPSRSVRDQERLSLGRDAVLSLGRAAELLPLADGKARAWLRERGLVVPLQCGGSRKEVVHWGSVLELLASLRTPAVPRNEVWRRLPLRRADLG